LGLDGEVISMFEDWIGEQKIPVNMLKVLIT
jgi:hypothetical protein